jgi:hypothetical protein
MVFGCALKENQKIVARGVKGLDRSRVGVIAKPKGVASWVEAKEKYPSESTLGGIVPLGS